MGRLRRIGLVAALGLGLGGPAFAAEKMTGAELAEAMAKVEQWVGGNYSTQAQHEADLAADTPDAEKHRLMYQLFRRVEAPAFEGLVFFEQGSRDGSEDPEMIWRSGLAQVLPDPALGVIRYRELAFKDMPAWHNAHRAPERFAALAPSDVTWDANCDFLLTFNADRTELAGPIPPKACGRMNEGTGQMMYADDKVVIKAGEFWFLGRYVDANGAHVWGNESDVLNKLVKRLEVE
ncbi:MAG: CpcT/CpeT family chromophore lyase [Rhodospirillaceae bacterium]|nr:CpcT/CpeT family chromophore lyase [Rhodospirillaceae bacterium]